MKPAYCDVVAFPARPRVDPCTLTLVAALSFMVGISLAAWMYEGGLRAMEQDNRAMSGLLVQRRDIARLTRPVPLERQVAVLRARQGLAPMPPWRKGGER